MWTASSATHNEPHAKPAVGVIGAYTGDSTTIKTLIVFFAGLTGYNAIELLILIGITFKQRKGLYFWSLTISSLGLIPYAIGFTVKLLGVIHGQARWTGLVLLTIGWWTMITGQSVVLWSRLHLIITPGPHGDKILRYTKWMIIINAVILHGSTSSVTFGSNATTLSHATTRHFLHAYNIIEKVQMTGFCLQEAVLSFVYITCTLGILRTSLRSETRAIMRQLVLINAAIILMDVGLLSIEYASLFLLETILKGFTYSIKLKLEFAILSRLVKFVGGRRQESAATTSPAKGLDLPVVNDGYSRPANAVLTHKKRKNDVVQRSGSGGTAKAWFDEIEIA